MVLILTQYDFTKYVIISLDYQKNVVNRVLYKCHVSDITSMSNLNFAIRKKSCQITMKGKKMQISQNLKLKQSQSLVMTPQLQQAIKLLQLNNLELSNLINKELEENPF